MANAVVIPVLNQLAYTQGCLQCLQPDIAAGTRVIVIDNGSDAETRDWLARQPGITVIRNEKNRGCAPAWNQGVKAAGDAEWIVVLNNDVLLPKGWLKALIGAAKKHGLDIVCPSMRERDLNYDFEKHAREFSANLIGIVRRGGAHGVAFAVRREVFEKIGGFDEAFLIGQFEDADFFRRARLAGFQTGIVGDCFIHHFGSVTQDALSDRGGTRPYEAENRAHFRKKWKLSWARRRWEKLQQAWQAWLWRTHERHRFGQTMHEKFVGGKIRQY